MPAASAARRHPEIPPALEAVIRRCLEPDPGDRYHSAAELAADLQAVADDLPLCHAREPWPSRATGWLRRRRRRLATAAAILAGRHGRSGRRTQLAARANPRTYKLVQQEYDLGIERIEERRLCHRESSTSTPPSQLADRLELSPWGYLAKLRNFRQFGSHLTEKLQELRSGPDLEDIKGNAHEKSKLAERYRSGPRAMPTHCFRRPTVCGSGCCSGEGSELTRASHDLQEVLAPFYVLENADWTKLDHTLTLLDEKRRDRLLVEVNELLFLWMAAIDESLASNRDRAEQPRVPEDRAAIGRALSICERALVWVEPKGPWLALEARLRAHQAVAGSGLASPGGRIGLPPIAGRTAYGDRRELGPRLLSVGPAL